MPRREGTKRTEGRTPPGSGGLALCLWLGVAGDKASTDIEELCSGIWVSLSRFTSWDYILTSPPFPPLPCRINLFTNNLEGPVLDHRYYAGVCSPHYILNTRFRKPYNVENFTPQVCASREATSGPWQGPWQRSQKHDWSAAPYWASSNASHFLSELQFFTCKMGGCFLQTQW